MSADLAAIAAGLALPVQGGNRLVRPTRPLGAGLTLVRGLYVVTVLG